MRQLTESTFLRMKEYQKARPDPKDFKGKNPGEWERKLSAWRAGLEGQMDAILIMLDKKGIA